MNENDSKQVININGKPSPAILASLLGINVSMVYQGRQDGKLPPNPETSYRECITYYCNYWKTKSSSKVNNVGEAALLQKIKLDAAKTESQWLDIKQKKMELLDIAVLAEIFEPIFLHIRTQLVSISRKFPQTQETIDKSLEELFHLGESIFSKGQEDLDSFIQMKMSEGVDITSLEDSIEEAEKPLNSFDDYIPVLSALDDLG